MLEAVRNLEKKSFGRGDINPFLNAGWRIRDAMPIAPSIDNFVHTHRDNKEIVGMAKIGIVHAICAAERRSRMIKYDERDDDRKDLFAPIEDTWIRKFWSILTEGVEKNKLGEIFENVSFIIFNYDRCIEHFLFHALQVYFDISANSARKILERVQIVHPYGVVGDLPWQNSTANVPFGAQRFDRVSSSERISTFTELEDSKFLPELKRQVASSDTLVFLGFSFLDLNMNLLRVDGTRVVNRIFGTAYSVSDYNCEVIRRNLARRFARDGAEVHLRNELKCAAFFDYFERDITIPPL